MEKVKNMTVKLNMVKFFINAIQPLLNSNKNSNCEFNCG